VISPTFLLAPTLATAPFIYAFWTSNFLSGKLIVFLLLGASVLAWSLMLTKRQELKRAQEESERFVQAFRRENHPIALFLRRQAFPASPTYKIFESACLAVGVELEARGSQDELFHRGLDNVRMTPLQVGAVRNAAERQVADQILGLEERMGLLATAVSASPMLGLLGTVWGVMDSFVEMAQQGTVNLQAVAPGIAGALLTTVIGLLVAIPSAIGYNLLASRVRKMSVYMDNFADEFMAEVQRHFIRE
jgi:biopolymer transport protein TolQ